jgi:hypothetical protein
MSAIFVILSGLLLVFSFVGPEEKGLQILLSLAGGSLIIYQVGCLILYRKALLTFSEGGYLSLYCANCLRWLRWAPLICFIVTAVISILIASSVGSTKASKITLLSFFLAEYLVIFIVYLVTFLLGTFYPVVHSLILWNMGLCCVAGAGALASLIVHLKGRLNFITFLWVSSKFKLSYEGKFF